MKRTLALLAIAALTSLPILAQQADEQGPGTNAPVSIDPISIRGADAADDLFVGTGAFGGSVANPAFGIDVDTDTATQIFSQLPVWGAAYDAANERVLFTSSGTDPVDGADLWEWPTGGGMPTLIGSITGGAGSIRIDGLAFSGGTLYGVHQFDSADGAAGLYSIDLGTLQATFEVALTSGAVSGIDGDPDTGTIYGADDTAGQIVAIDPGTGSTNVAAYPPAETDLDGVAVGNGKIYLVPDDETPGEIFVYDIATGMYEASLTAPWGATADTFSGGAFIAPPPEPAIPTVDIPTLSGMGVALLATILAGAGLYAVRRRRGLAG